MDMQIVSKEKNQLLKRQDVKFEINGAKTVPSRKDVRQKIAALANAKEDSLVVNRISHNFGSHNVFGTAKIYESAQAMKKTEQKYVLARNFGREEKKEQAPKQAAEQEEQKEIAKGKKK